MATHWSPIAPRSAVRNPPRRRNVAIRTAVSTRPNAKAIIIGFLYRVSAIECPRVNFGELGGLVSAGEDQERILIISRPGEERQIGKVQEELDA